MMKIVTPFCMSLNVLLSLVLVSIICIIICFFLLQIIGPLEEGEVFNQDDFLLLESIILKTSGERIKSNVQKLGVEEDRYENQSAFCAVPRPHNDTPTMTRPQ